MLTLVPLVVHDHKCHLASHFNHLDLTNAVMPLMMPVASHGANTIANDIIGPIKSCCTLFQSSLPKESNGTTDHAIVVM